MTSSKVIDMSEIFVSSTTRMLRWPEITASPIAALEGPDGPMTVAMDTCLSRLTGCRNLRRLKVCVWQHGADLDATQIGTAIAYQSLLPGFDPARGRLVPSGSLQTCESNSESKDQAQTHPASRERFSYFQEIPTRNLECKNRNHNHATST